jgi:hypothetical protein
MGNLRIGPYLAFVSKFWAVEDLITRSRTASGHVDGAEDLLWPEVECVEEELGCRLRRQVSLDITNLAPTT